MKLFEMILTKKQQNWLVDKGLTIEYRDTTYNIVDHAGAITQEKLTLEDTILYIDKKMNASADLFEMTNLSGQRTGLPVYVFCSAKGNAPHECRIKVCNVRGNMNEDDVFSIAIKDLAITGECRLNSDDLERVKWWIHYNRFILLDYWKYKIDTIEFLMTVKNIFGIKISKNKR